MLPEVVLGQCCCTWLLARLLVGCDPHASHNISVAVWWTDLLQPDNGIVRRLALLFHRLFFYLGNVMPLSPTPLVVLTPYHPSKLSTETVDTTNEEDGKNRVVPMLSERDKAKDDLDGLNHPRLRQALILSEFYVRHQNHATHDIVPLVDIVVVGEPVDLKQLQQEWMELYSLVHSDRLLQFLVSAWSQWCSFYHAPSPVSEPVAKDKNGEDDNGPKPTPPLTLAVGSSPLPREDSSRFEQRPSQHVVGQMGFYCTDVDTPGTYKSILLSRCSGYPSTRFSSFTRLNSVCRFASGAPRGWNLD